jgi:hypothetical protein
VTERATKEVEYQQKTMKSTMGERLSTNVGSESKILTRAMECASALISGYLLDQDGKTACERMKDKISKTIGIEFAETLMLRRVPAPGRLGKLGSLGRRGPSSDIRPRAASTWSRTQKGCIRHGPCGEYRPRGDGWRRASRISSTPHGK